MKYLAIFFIDVYQKCISPYKGFCCAHAALNDGESCSNAIKNMIQIHGLCSSYYLIRGRFIECNNAYLQLQKEADELNKKKKKENKYDCCDPSLPCDALSCLPKKGCDLPELPCGCSIF